MKNSHIGILITQEELSGNVIYRRQKLIPDRQNQKGVLLNCFQAAKLLLGEPEESGICQHFQNCLRGRSLLPCLSPAHFDQVHNGRFLEKEREERESWSGVLCHNVRLTM